MNKFFALLLNRAAALVESVKRGLQGGPKFYDLGLEEMVRTQLKDATRVIDEAFATSRTTHARVEVPSIEWQIGHAGLKLTIADRLAEGIVEATYTGPQASWYFDMLNYGHLDDVCHVLDVNLDPGTYGGQPGITARLRLPINVAFG